MKKYLLQKVGNIFSIYIGFSRMIYIFFIIRLINAMGFFVFPFLTLFLTINLSLSTEKVILYLMCIQSSQIVGALTGGRFADIFGRKIVLIGFQFAIAIFLFPCAFLGDSLLIPKILIFAGFFQGAIRPIYDAMAIDLSTPKNRKEMISFIYLGVNLGLGIGVLIAGFLFNHYIKLLFLGNVAVILIVCLFANLFILETLPYEIRLKKNRSVKKSMLSLLMKKPIVLYFLLVSILFYLVHSQILFSLPIQINDIFGQAGPRYFGIVMSFNCFAVALMTMFITIISRKNRPILNVTFSGILFAIGFGMLYWVSQLNWLLVSTFIWTMGEILIQTNVRVYIANHSPVTHRGRFNSLVTISESVSRIIGPPVFGYIIIYLGIQQVWVFTFFISIIATVLMYFIYIFERDNKNYAEV